MARDISATNITASQAEVVRPVLFAKLEFSSETIYLNNLAMPITFGGNTYQGVGAFGSITAVQEGTELKTYNLEMTLTGIPSTYISVALNIQYKNRDATVYLGFLNSSWTLVDTPFILFKGRMDTMNIEMGEEGTVILSIVDRFKDWERPRIRRYNDADQKIYYSDDDGFEFVPQMVEKVLIWGKG